MIVKREQRIYIALLVDLSRMIMMMKMMIAEKVIIYRYLPCNYNEKKMRKRSKIPCKYKLFSTLNRTFMTSVLTSISLKYKLVKKLYE